MRAPVEIAEDGRRVAIVVFEHRHTAGILRLLRPGFRHCFCLLRTADGWLLCDPLKGSLRLEVLPPFGEFDLLRHYSSDRRHALLGRTAAAAVARLPGLRPLTCVEVVKRALGLEASAVLTPFQLYARLLSTREWTSADNLAPEVDMAI